jgi:pimeloyl-ACP methyl ester carboxylesterase
VKDSYVNIEGHRLRFRWLGDPNKEKGMTLVFLHEGLGCIESWKDFPARLCSATGLNGLLYDRKGYGKSALSLNPRTKAYLHEEAWDCLPLLLDKLDIDKPFLVGHSDGATIALLYAARYPATAVVSISGHILVEEEALRGIRKFGKLYAHGEMRYRLEQLHGDKTDRVYHDWADTWLDPAFRDWDIRAELSGVSCPVLAIQGDRDEYASNRHPEMICQAVGGLCDSYLIPGAGHVPHLQKGEMVLQEIVRFLG